MKSSKCAWFVASWATAGNAWAEPPTECPKCVELSPPVCLHVPIDRHAYADALRVELAAAGFTLGTEPSAPSGVTVAVEPVPCEPGATSIEVVATNARSGARNVRQVDVSDLDPGIWARTVALASAELVERTAAGEAVPTTRVAASPSAVATSTPPTAAPTPAPTAAPPAEAAAPRVPAVPPELGGAAPGEALRAPILPERSALSYLGALFEVRDYFAPKNVLFGGRVASSWKTPWDPFELRADAFFETSARDVTLGRVDTRMAAAATGADWTFGSDRLRVALGPSIDVGYVWTAGTATGTAVSGEGGRLAAALMAETSVRAYLTRALLGIAEVGFGVELSGLRAVADSQPVSGASGAFVTARAGIAIAP